MDIDVKTGKLREKSEEQKKIRNELNTINNSIQTSRKKLQLCLTSSASEKIDSTLNAACDSLQNITDDLGSMADGLDTIVGLYEAAEQDISGNKPSEDAINEVKNEAEEWTGIKWGKMLGDVFKKFSKVGFIGTMGVDLWKVLQDGNWVNGLVDVLKLGKDVVANGFEKMSGTAWKEILIGKWNVGKKVVESITGFGKHPIKSFKK